MNKPQPPDLPGAPSPAPIRVEVGILEDLFSYHKPSEDQIPRYTALREAALEFAKALDQACPPSADRTAAMRQLQDCVMTANRSVALRGRSYR